MRNRLLLCAQSVLLLLGLAMAEQPAAIQYISPVDGSYLNSRTGDIIIRPGAVIDPASIKESGLVSVTGSVSGKHSGRLILARDGRTVIFKPHLPFDAGETVTVAVTDGLREMAGKTIPGFTFHFTVTPLAQPLKADQYLKKLHPQAAEHYAFGTDASRISTQSEHTTEEAFSDTLPADFPTYKIVTNGSASPGYIFLTPSHFVSNDGYNLILDNSGEIIYYNKISGGIPVDLKVLANGMLSYGIINDFYASGAAAAIRNFT